MFVSIEQKKGFMGRMRCRKTYMYPLNYMIWDETQGPEGTVHIWLVWNYQTQSPKPRGRWASPIHLRDTFWDGRKACYLKDTREQQLSHYIPGSEMKFEPWSCEAPTKSNVVSFHCTHFWSVGEQHYSWAPRLIPPRHGRNIQTPHRKNSSVGLDPSPFQCDTKMLPKESL